MLKEWLQENWLETLIIGGFLLWFLLTTIYEVFFDDNYKEFF